MMNIDQNFIFTGDTWYKLTPQIDNNEGAIEVPRREIEMAVRILEVSGSEGVSESVLAELVAQCLSPGKKEHLTRNRYGAARVAKHLLGIGD